MNVLDKIVQSMKPQIGLFSSKTELNKAILNEVGLYITELVTNENVNNVNNVNTNSTSYLREQIQQDKSDKLIEKYSNKKLEFESFHSKSPPKHIQFEDDTSLDNNNIEDMLKKEIAERDNFDSSITNEKQTLPKLHTNTITNNESILSISKVDNYQTIEGPVFSLSSLQETSETNEKKKVPSSKPIKSILKNNHSFITYPSSYSKWFIDLNVTCGIINKENKSECEIIFMIQDESFLSFINSHKKNYTSLIIEQLCIHNQVEPQDTEYIHLKNNLLYIYTYTKSFELNTNSILFPYHHAQLQDDLQKQPYSLYKGNCPFRNYDNRHNENNIGSVYDNITHIVLSTIPLKSSDVNSNFSLFYTLPEKEKREKNMSVQLRF